MKMIKGLVLSLLISTTVLMPKTSHAGAGLVVAAFGPTAIMTAGLYTTAAGVGSISLGFLQNKIFGKNNRNAGQELIIYGFVFILPLGILILDNEQKISFNELSASDATALGITALERKSFNAEIDQVNALASFVTSELEQNESADVEDARQMWTSVQDSVEPATFSALQKISMEIYK